MRSIARPFRRLYCAPLRVAATTLSLTLLLALLASPGSLFAQPAAVPNAARITQAVDESKLVTLKGNVSRATLVSDDRGAAPVSEPMKHLQLLLQRSPAQEAALRSYLASVQVKSSQDYHKWLTPAQFGALYGPVDADVQKLTGWLEGRGFTVNKVTKGRIAIEFSGSVAQVQEAFQTPIHSFQWNGTQFLANTRDPKIPAAFSSVVAGIANLNTWKPVPQNIKGRPGQGDSKSHQLVSVTSPSQARAQFTGGTSSNPFLYLVPGDAATIYDTPNTSLNLNYNGNTSFDGTGVTIGVAGQSTIDTAAAVNYRTLFLPTYSATAPTVIDVDGVGQTDAIGESYLDVEIAGGLAPGANIDLYAANGVGDAAIAAIEDNVVDILSVSYGNCESTFGNSGNQFFNAIWQQAAAQGITVVVSTGDNGSAGCDATTDGQGNDLATATGGLAVNGIASTPYNIAIGGTDFYLLGGNYTGYASLNYSNNYTSALNYIDESTWNDSTSLNTTVSANVPWPASSQSPPPNIFAGSGGASNCAVQPSDSSGQGYVANCTSGYTNPSWQVAPGVPNNGVRNLPDLSLFSGDGLDSAAWVVCDNSTNTSNGVTTTSDCSLNAQQNFYFDAYGGTSTATPAFAGMMAMVVQKTGQRQGQAAPIFYSLYNSSSASSIFNDITVGNISVPCTQNAQNTASCVQNGAGYFFETGFDTSANYDLATGLGSLDVTGLVSNWANASALFTPVLALNVSPTTITSAQPFTVSVTASGPSGSPTPTGSVTVAVGSYVSPTATALVNGVASVTVPGSTLTSPGAYLVLVSYTPDTASSKVYYYGSATSVVTVSGTAPGGTINIGSPAPTTATVSSPGQSGTSTITLTPAGGYTGTVNFTCTLATAPTGAATAYNPACSIPATKVTGTAAQTVTASFSTTAPTSGALAYPETNREGRWYTAVGGAALACILFFGIPARRRGWRSMLSLLFFLVAMAGVGCGGGGGGNNNGTPGTTTGTYTFNVTATDSAVATITSNATITVTVQ